MRKFIHEKISKTLLVLLAFMVHHAYGQVISNVKVTDVTCKGLNDGKIEVTFSHNATDAFVIELWNGGSLIKTHTTASITANTISKYEFTGVAPMTNYLVKVTPNLGGGASAGGSGGFFTVGEPTALVLNYNVHHVKCFGENNGAVKLLPTGGTVNSSADYLFKKGTGSYSNIDTFSGFIQGTVNFTVADLNGCEANASVVITQPNLLQISKSVTNGTCQGSGSLVLSSSGGTGSKEYSIASNGGAYSTTSTFSTLDNINNAKAYVKDANLCLDSTTYTIKYNDNVAPTANGKNITAYLDSATGLLTVSAALLDNGSFDNCGPVRFEISDSTFSCADTGVNTVNFHVIDTTGNVSTVNGLKITVRDSTKPTLRIFAVTKLYLDQLGSANLTASMLDSIAPFDACGIAADSTYLGQLVFSCTHAGNTVNVAYRVEDKNDNSRTVTAKVLALDTIAPQLQLNTLSDRFLDSQGRDTLFLHEVLKTVTDACGVDSVYFDQAGTDTFMLFTCSNKGANTVGVIAEDKFGNKRYASVSVNIKDNIAPDSFKILLDTTLYLDISGNANISKNKVVIYANDNCGVVDTTMQTAFDCDDLGAKNYTVTIKDAEGNQTSKTIEITVRDTFKPEVPVVYNITRYLDSIGADTITITDLYDASSVADNCGVTKIYTSDTFFTCGDLGSRAVTVYFEDASGNISSEVATIEYEDTLAPYNLKVKDPVTVYLLANGTYSLHDSDYLISLDENCTIKDTVYSQQDFTCADMDPLGKKVIVTFTDLSGNASKDSFTVFVLDTIKPVLNILQKDTLFVPAVVGETVSLATADVDLGSFDNNTCVPLDLQFITRSVFDCDDVNKKYFVVIKATDASGNISYDSTEVLILDTVKPVIVLKPVLPTFYLDANGVAVVNINDVDDGTFDNCGILLREIIGKDLDCDSVGVRTVSYRAVDKFGNESIKIFNITVADSIKPTLTVQNATILIDTSSNAYLKESDVVVSHSDNCSPNTVVISKMIFGLADLGDNSVEITVTDSKGNVTKKTVTVTVILGDADNDSIPDYIEKNFDTDGDLTLDYMDIDSDNDGLADKVENNEKHALVDTDNDGVSDFRDLDSDNDGINDVIENGSTDANGDGLNDNINNVIFAAIDTDNDGDDDYRDLDSDGDTLYDIIESLQGIADLNNDGKIDNATDTDTDGILDAADGSVNARGDSGDTKPVDTNNDGEMDFRDLDSDGDKIPDTVEGNVDTNTDGEADFRDLDSDGDKIPDTYEAGVDPTKPVDTDNDGKEDFRDTDSDGDKIPDSYEAGIDPTKPVDTNNDGKEDFRDLDSDGDTIPDEIEAGTDPNNPVDTNNDGDDNFRDLDSDGDCIPDKIEAGSDPNNPVNTDNLGDADYIDTDSDEDGILDNIEVGSDCNNPRDTDGDGVFDFRSLDTDSDDIPDSEEGLADSDNNGIPDYRDAQFRIPEAFSPNGDGVNELLIINGLKVYTQAQLIIFNRNGHVVFDSGKGYKNNWNGSNNSGMFTIGTELPEGLYYYVFKPNGQNRKDVTGNIYIKR